MGFLDTVKGWLNIGGVTCKLKDYTERLQRSKPVITGTVVMTTKSPKKILKVEVKLVEQWTHGEGDKRKTEEAILARWCAPEHDKGIGYPFDIKPGDTKEQPFTLNVTLSKRLQDFGGVLGAVGKVGAFLSKEKVEYHLIAVADVQGTPFDPTHRVSMPIAT